MFLSAVVRDKKTKEIHLIERDYDSKKAFEKDLRSNGYAITRISSRRDIAAQDVGYETFAAMKKDYENRFGYNRDFYREKFEALAEIESIKL